MQSWHLGDAWCNIRSKGFEHDREIMQMLLKAFFPPNKYRSIFKATLTLGVDNFITRQKSVDVVVTSISERYHLPLIHPLYTFLSPWHQQ